MRWPWSRRTLPPVEHPREAEWDEIERQQREGMVRERIQRRDVEARISAVLRDFEDMADPQLVRKLRRLRLHDR